MSKVFVSLQKIVSYACYGIVLVLAIVSIVVINNTIKITVFNRRKEINIMKLGSVPPTASSASRSLSKASPPA